MKEKKPEGRAARTDVAAESAIEGMPPWLARPKNAPAYHGFPILEGSEKDGYRFGVITDPNGEEPATWGDAYVIAPDGSRAGITWSVQGDAGPNVVLPPEKGRWGVYAFRFQHPVRSDEDLIRNLHEVLPHIKAFYEAALRDVPESTNGGCAS